MSSGSLGSASGQSFGGGFDDAYIGVPPWDIGRAQREVLALADAGAFRSTVLASGCGTGENTVALAARGLEVLGLDASPRAVGKAMDKARDRGLAGADFLVTDVFGVGGLGRAFGSALDCGLFHVLDDHERPVYVASLHDALEPGGLLHVLCFSDAAPPGKGPRRVSEDELRASFSEGWQVREIAATVFETTLQDGDVPAWRATFARA
ncbi:class I SAM-dependent methyltransferase [soil metagenome]